MHRAADRLICMSARLLALSLLLLAACTDPPVTYSTPVGILLQARSSEATNGIVTDLKAITTEQGNPYGAFIAEARTQLAGKSPGAIVLGAATVTLADGSTGVSGLGEVFSGTLSIVFLIDDTNHSFGVATGQVAVMGGSTLPLDVHFDSVALTELDYGKLLGGKFKVIARGTAAPGFADLGARGDLDVLLTFTAFE